MREKVSVIIPLYNTEKYIAETLRSVLSQTWGEVEIIVVNDGSTDGSADVVRNGFPGVRLVETSNNGLSRARNIGTEHATGDYIQYLDADDLISPHKLEAQLEILRRTGADIAYCDWARLQLNADGLWKVGAALRAEIKDADIDLFTAASWNPIHGYLFRRSMVQKVGCWDERLSIVQDNRFLHDCALKGALFAHCEEVLAYYRVHSSQTLSHRDPRAFLRDCLANDAITQALWERDGGISEKRRHALLKAYGYVARASYCKDSDIFETAYRAILTLNPKFIPDYPRHLTITSKLLGYRRAEFVAFWYRRAKKLVSAGA